jgi:hypothetical protein
MDLGSALEAIRTAYKAEGRAKMSRDMLAEHLGYTSLNGRALAKMGAVRAYGLIEGREDDIRVTQDAIICLEAPADSHDRADALQRCSTKPPIFREIQGVFPSPPSESNLRFHLIKLGYTAEAAGKAAANYLATMRLVEESSGAYSSGSPPEAEPDTAQDVGFDMLSPAKPFPGIPLPPPQSLASGEREWLRGPLSREISYRLIVNGEMGPKQIGKLIKLLEAQKAVLDDDDEPSEFA